MSGQCDKESLGTRDISTQRGADVGTHGRGSLHALRVHTARLAPGLCLCKGRGVGPILHWDSCKASDMEDCHNETWFSSPTLA